MHIPGVTETKKKVGRKIAMIEKSTAEATLHPLNKEELYLIYNHTLLKAPRVRGHSAEENPVLT
jgi:hypothetical protein